MHEVALIIAGCVPSQYVSYVEYTKFDYLSVIV